MQKGWNMIDKNDNVQAGSNSVHGDAESLLYKSATRKATQHHRRVLGKGDERGSFTGEEWVRLCEQYHNKCVLCGFERPLTPDHIVPVYRGGPNTIDNIQPLCRPCNVAKYQTPADYRVEAQHGSATNTTTHEPAPRPIRRVQLLEIEQHLRRNMPGAHATGVDTVASRSVKPENGGAAVSEEILLVLIEEIRRLRGLVLENEALASVESVAWWSAGTLPAPLEAYLARHGGPGEAS